MMFALRRNVSHTCKVVDVFVRDDFCFVLSSDCDWDVPILTVTIESNEDIGVRQLINAGIHPWHCICVADFDCVQTSMVNEK